MSKRKLLGLGAEPDFNQALWPDAFNPTNYSGLPIRDQAGNQIIINTQNSGRELGASWTGRTWS